MLCLIGIYKYEFTKHVRHVVRHVWLEHTLNTLFISEASLQQEGACIS